MKPTILLSLLALLLPFPAGAQTADDSEAATHRPLNLSLPRDLTRTPAISFGASAGQDPVADNLRPAQVSGGPGRIPYGSGYEARQRGAANRGDAVSAPGTHSNGSRSGSGGGGRGGMGRGR